MARPVRPIEAVAAACRVLFSVGFKKRSGGEIFTTEVAAGILGWLGLNRGLVGSNDAVIEINPVVGIRHQEIERIVAELKGVKFHGYAPPTVSVHLGYVTTGKVLFALVLR